MVVATLRIVPVPKRRPETLEILRSIQGPTLAQPGCKSCRVYEELGPERGILLCERWDSEAALHEHIRSELYRRVLAAIELSNRAPEICFHHVSGTQGLGLIEELRGDGGDTQVGSPATPRLQS